jgi:hypothetical protein
MDQVPRAYVEAPRRNNPLFAADIPDGEDRGLGRGQPAYAPASRRLCPSQARPRHQRATSLARAQEHPAHGALHRAGAGQV